MRINAHAAESDNQFGGRAGGACAGVEPGRMPQAEAQPARPVLLEPIVKLEITIPERFMGDIMGDLNSKRGRILGSESHGRRMTIQTLVPQAEVFTYSRDLRSLTQGRGTYKVTFDHYERVPPEIQAKAVAAYEKEKEEARA